MEKQVEAVIEDMATKLADGYGVDQSEEDLHYLLCNSEPYIIGTYNAKKFFGEHAFDAIEIIKEWEEDVVGEVTTDFSNPETVANMYAYIIGERVLQFSKHLYKCTDQTLTAKDINKIKREIAGVKAWAVIMEMDNQYTGVKSYG